MNQNFVENFKSYRIKKIKFHRFDLKDMRYVIKVKREARRTFQIWGIHNGDVYTSKLWNKDFSYDEAAAEEYFATSKFIN